MGGVDARQAGFGMQSGEAGEVSVNDGAAGEAGAEEVNQGARGGGDGGHEGLFVGVGCDGGAGTRSGGGGGSSGNELGELLEALGAVGGGDGIGGIGKEGVEGGSCRGDGKRSEKRRMILKSGGLFEPGRWPRGGR